MTKSDVNKKVPVDVIRLSQGHKYRCIDAKDTYDSDYEMMTTGFVRPWDNEMTIDLDGDKNMTFGYHDDFYAGNVKTTGFEDETDLDYSYNFRRSSSFKTQGALIAFALTAVLL